MSQLAESDRKRLDGIVQKMIANGEDDNDIQFVVNDFKKKYSQAGFLSKALTQIKAQKLPPNYKPPVPSVSRKPLQSTIPTVPTQDPAKAVNGMEFAGLINQLGTSVEKRLGPLNILPSPLKTVGMSPAQVAKDVIMSPLDIGADLLVFADAKSTPEQQAKALTNFALKSGIVPAGWVAGKLAKQIFNKAVQLLQKGRAQDAKKLIAAQAPSFDIPTGAKPIEEVLEGFPGKKEAPTSPVAKNEDATGLANQVQTREVEAGILREIPATKGKSPEELQKLGKEAFGGDYDFEGLARRIASGEESPSAEKFGILLEGKRQLRADVNRAANALKESPGDAKLIKAYDESKERLQEFAENVQRGKGEWSDMGRALQAGTDLDTGDFAQVLEEAKRHGKVNPKMEATLKKQTEQIQDLTSKLEVKERELAEVRAGGAVEKAKRGPRFDRASLDKELEDLFAEGKKKLGQASAGLDPELVQIAGKIALNYAKRGVNTLDEIVTNVQEVWKAQFGQDIDRQTVIDAMGTKQTAPKTRSELQKQITSLRAQAKRESTAGKAQVQAKIDDLQRQIETGDYHVPTKRDLQVSKELENLRAERDIYAGQVRAGIRNLADSNLKKGAKFLASNIRGTILGSDIGVLTRQGLFGLSRPVEFAKGVGKGLKASLNEQNLSKIERNIFDHEVLPGTKAGLIYKKAGLSTTDHLTNPEELVVANLLKKVPGLGKLAGAGQRFQSAFINTLRSETMDRAIRLGYSEKELALRANFINSATGRSNAKQIPTALEFIMTSPRYERSRWEMIGHALKDPAILAKDLATGKLNKGALANVQDMAVTAAEVYGLYKLAELSGYSVDFDPTSADFLKMRKGDEVWDPSAGIAPRLRDLMRFVAWGMEPTNNQNVSRLLSAAGTRTISPAIKQPTEYTAQAIQRAKGVPEDKINSFFTGWKLDEDDKGLWPFAPLIIQTSRKYLNEGDVAGAVSAGGREFVGQSLSRYPKPQK